jgi:hypothetical protein
MTEDDVIFDGSDVDEWQTVNTSDQYDLEFIDNPEQGATFVGEYDGERTIGDSKYPSLLIKDHQEETTYAFSTHTILKDGLEEAGEGQLVRVVYEGKKDVGQPNDAHDYTVQTPAGN